MFSLLGSPTDANVVRPVGRAEASVACRFSRAVSTFAHRLPNASDPVGIRTRDPQLRRLLLYPAELPDRAYRHTKTVPN